MTAFQVPRTLIQRRRLERVLPAWRERKRLLAERGAQY